MTTKQMINNAIFDLDGTLLDTSEGIIESVKYAIKKMNLSEIEEDKLLHFVGPPLKNSFMQHCEVDEEEANVAVKCFREYYADKALLKAEPYEGIYELLESLKENNIRLSVATYKPEEYAIKILKHFKMEDYFNSIQGADKAGFLKKEVIVQLSLDDVCGTADDTVLIGDTHGDEEAAHKLGMWFLPVTYGFGYHMNIKLDYEKCIGIACYPSDIGKIIVQS